MPIPEQAVIRLNTRRCSLGRILMEPQDEAMRMFDKYRSGIARRLKKAEALKMLEVEFHLCEQDAQTMFQAFDKDDNEVMSVWEFRQFYQTIGMGANDMLSRYKELEVQKDGVGTGLVDIDRTFDALRDVESAKGKLTDEEIKMLLMTTAGEEKEIDLRKFLNLMCRIKVFRGQDQ